MNTAEIANLVGWPAYLFIASRTARHRFERVRNTWINTKLRELKDQGALLGPKTVDLVVDQYNYVERGDNKVGSFFYGMGWPITLPVYHTFADHKRTIAEVQADTERHERDRDEELRTLQLKIDQLARQAKQVKR